MDGNVKCVTLKILFFFGGGEMLKMTCRQLYLQDGNS